MINIESMVFTAVYKAVMEKFPKAYVTGESENAPSAFPCVSVVEVDNYTYTRSQDDSMQEHHANLTYEVNVYSNLGDKNKEEAKSIMSVVDEAMQNMKFTRQSMMITPNLDRTKYRLTARYRVIVAEGEELNGKTIYKMYRK